MKESEQRLEIAGLCGRVLAMLQFKSYTMEEIKEEIRKVLQSLDEDSGAMRSGSGAGG